MTGPSKTRPLTKAQVRMIDFITAHPGWQFAPGGVYGRGFRKTLVWLIKNGFLAVDDAGAVSVL